MGWIRKKKKKKWGKGSRRIKRPKQKNYYHIAGNPKKKKKQAWGSADAYENINGMDGQERGKLAQLYWENATIDYRDHHDSDCFQDFLDRVDLFIKRIESFNDNSLFFGHGIWIALLAWRLLGCPIETTLDIKSFRQFQTALPLDNTVIYKLSISQDGVKQLQKFDLFSQ